MKPTVTMRRALSDVALLGGVLDGESWQAWRVLLIASMGEALTDSERVTFTAMTGRACEPLQRVEELVCCVGRRGGKSRAMAVLATYISALCKHPSVRGEKLFTLCIAPDQRQATITLDYCEAAFLQSPMLRQLISNRSADTLTLTNGIAIEVRAASFRRLRGPTYCAVLCDEAAYWMTTDSYSVNPDHEIIGACRPGLSTTGGMLCIASSPYAKRGVLFETHKRHYGADGDPLILVAQGSSRTFNETLPQSVVDRALERDRAAASADYLAQFRNDIESFIAFEVVENCVGDHVELPPSSAIRYNAAVDPSGASVDSFTLAISHRDGERTVIDCIREMRPPFSPERVVDSYATLLKTYRCDRVTGDRYAGEWPREQFRKRGIQYECAALPKSDLYRDLLPLLNSGSILLPRSDRLIAQLSQLERRTARSGRDSIDHPPGQHDDVANCVALAASLAHKPRGSLVASTIQIYGNAPDAVGIDSGLRSLRLPSGKIVLRNVNTGAAP
jgi:hypothetical protein